MKIKELKKTPFAICEMDEGKFCLICGNQRVSDYFDTEKDAINYAKQKPWELICAVTGIMIEKINEIKNLKIK